MSRTCPLLSINSTGIDDAFKVAGYFGQLLFTDQRQRLGLALHLGRQGPPTVNLTF